MLKQRSQRELARALLRERGILRLAELCEAGVNAATMSRMEQAGKVVRLSRGVYQLPDCSPAVLAVVSTAIPSPAK
jgi:hypothetical protein